MHFAIYDHDAVNNRPGNRLYDSSFASGIVSGIWKTQAVAAWTLTPGSTYWLAVWIQNTATAWLGDKDADAGAKLDYISPAAGMPNPWGASSGTEASLLALYALYTPTPPPPTAGDFLLMFP